MKNMQYIGVYCSDTVSYASVELIKKLWRGKYGKNPGYDFLVMPNGKIIELRFDGMVGREGRCINFCYVGGRKKDGSVTNFWTQEQQDAIFDKIVHLTVRYPEIKIRPDDLLYNSDGFTKPNFSIQTWLKIFVPRELRAAGIEYSDLSR
jgi:hypothetical protein